jgi:hypothetical protein
MFLYVRVTYSTKRKKKKTGKISKSGEVLEEEK